MNYKRLYDSIIENRKQNPSCAEYTEVHHIIPRSLGGLDDKNNLVTLSAREHFICHYLLAKIYPKESLEWYKMNNAFLMMKCDSYNQNRYYNSRLYEALRGNFSAIMSKNQTGKNNSQYGTMWIYSPELKENKRIKIYQEIPEGWVKGRKIKQDKKQTQCIVCGSNTGTRRRKYCDEHRLDIQKKSGEAFGQRTKEQFLNDECYRKKALENFKRGRVRGIKRPRKTNRV